MKTRPVAIALGDALAPLPVHHRQDFVGDVGAPASRRI